MAIIKSFFQNAGYLLKQKVPRTPITNQEVGLAGINYNTQEDPMQREAIYPNWFFSARLGQPRNVDTRKLRQLAKSPWIQMVVTTFKKQIETIEWRIVPVDEEGDIDRSKDIQICEDFFNNINKNKQTITDINSEAVTDIAEIDAGCFNYVYTADSYVIGEVPLHNAWGQVVGTEIGLVLKPLGQRELTAVKTVDGSTMLKQVDIHKNMLNFWQYSFKHPRQNPTRFETDEIEYIMLNPRSYDVYGFAPTQSVQQVVELLIQGTRYNKDMFTNNALPDTIISLPKLPKSDLQKLKRGWNNNYKGKPHQIGFINWAIENITKLNHNNRDMEWLEGQKWYFKLVFGAYGVSPTEAGFFENANKSNDESQSKVTVRNALKPYFKKLEQVHTVKTISEILKREDHGLMFKYFPVDQEDVKLEFEQDMQELDHKTMTINEYRKKKGREPVEWGNEPVEQPSPFGFNNPNDMNNNNQDDNNPKDKDNNKQFKKSFEVFLNDRK